jgi:hypothetical protein
MFQMSFVGPPGLKLRTNGVPHMSWGIHEAHRSMVEVP